MHVAGLIGKNYLANVTIQERLFIQKPWLPKYSRTSLITKLNFKNLFMITKILENKSYVIQDIVKAEAMSKPVKMSFSGFSDREFW